MLPGFLSTCFPLSDNPQVSMLNLPITPVHSPSSVEVGTHLGIRDPPRIDVIFLALFLGKHTVPKIGPLSPPYLMTFRKALS